MAVRDEWKERFEKWKIEKEERLKRVEKPIKKFEEELDDVIESALERISNKNYIREPRHFRILKWIIIFVPLLIVGYLIYANFIVSQEFNYFYDIGLEKNYLSPDNRISENILDGINYVNLEGNLVYFDVPIARGSERVVVSSKFRELGVDDIRISLGARNKEEWSYDYNLLYDSSLDLLEYEKVGNVYAVNENTLVRDYDGLKELEGIVIATNKDFDAVSNSVDDYEISESVIDVSLRGGHTFYLYVEGNLNLEVDKQDINWYDGSDELVIEFYDINRSLISQGRIEDDGITGVDKSKAPVQKGKFVFENLEEGVYRLEFGNFDGLIRKIKVNTNKIVADSLFLADNPIYRLDEKESRVYFESDRISQLRMNTYHFAGIQKVLYNFNGSSEMFDFYKEDEPLYLSLEKGEYEFMFEKNDIIISGPFYFAFSKDNYFEPFKQKVVSINKDPEWLENNVDYLIIDYETPRVEEGWIYSETEFNLDELYVNKDGKLSFVYNAPHLGRNETSEYAVPLDWINITVYKSGVFKF